MGTLDPLWTFWVPCWNLRMTGLKKLCNQRRLIGSSTKKSTGGWRNILNCILADLQWRYIEPLIVKICLYRHLSCRVWWVTCCYWSFVSTLIRSHPSRLARCVRTKAFDCGDGHRCQCSVGAGLVVRHVELSKILVGLVFSGKCESNGWVRKSGLRIYRIKNRNMHSENIFKHRPWRIAAGHLYMNLPRSIHPFFVSRWLDLSRFFQGLHLHRFASKSPTGLHILSGLNSNRVYYITWIFQM